MPEKWDWPLEAPIKLMVPARKFDWKPSRYVSLPDKPITEGEDELISLVPYGNTYFRISMFPNTEKASK